MADKINKNRYRLSKIFKRALALFIIVIINFNSFSAVVSSNDGSAFITKAEFDALVNDFNSRIEDYEKSIDAKIDGAIAEYLAGLATASSYIMEDLIHVAKANSNNNLKFIRWKDPATAIHTNDVAAGLFLNKVACAANLVEEGTKGYAQITNSPINIGGIQQVTYTENDSSKGNIAYYYYAGFPFGTYDESDFRVTGNISTWYLSDVSRYRLHYNLVALSVVCADKATRFFTESGLDVTPPSEITINYSTGATGYMPGQKGQTIISSYMNQSWGATNTISHTWTKQADETVNSFLNYNLSSSISGTTHVIASSYKDNYSSTEYRKLNIQNTSSSGINLRIFNLTGNTSTGFKTSNKYVRSINTPKFYFEYNGVKVYNVYWANLVNSFYTTYFNIPYYKYYGIPICKPNKMTGDVTVKLKFSNTQVSSVYPAFTYQINDEKFSNGDLPSASNVLYNETVPQGNSSYTKEITITKDTVKDTTNGDYLYIKIQPSVANQIVSVDTEGDILITIEA